jgi:hypothetical protein
MERACEEATSEESARGGTRPAGRPGTQRSQEARQSGERPQGWPGQKPQEDYCGQTQRSTTKTRAPQESGERGDILDPRTLRKMRYRFWRPRHPVRQGKSRVDSLTRCRARSEA